jgi:sulfatase maturation enzyme AslB (radical SAM superfamily)
LKLALGASLRFKLVPARNINLCGDIHEWISAIYFGKKPSGFVQEMTIETASICNASCSFCSYPILEFPKKVMPEATFEKALQIARQRQVKLLDFTPYLGEAFVDPQFIPRLRRARKELPDAHLVFTTNGTFFTRINLEELLTSGVSEIHVSFGAWGKEDYLKLYNIDAWDRVYAGVEMLLATKSRLKANVRIALWYRVLDATAARANPENVAFLKRFQDVIDETEFVDIYHDLVDISGQQPAFLKLERKIDSSLLKETPCIHLGKIACSSSGNLFSCFCAGTDCYKQEKSWFYLGTSGATPQDLNQALSKKINEWKSGHIPECCKTCPIYHPATKSEPTMDIPNLSVMVQSSVQGQPS